MPSINRQSLREEFTALKGRFGQLSSDGKVGAESRAPFPETFSGPVQYGAGIKAYVLNLLIAQMISLKRVQHSIQTLIAQVISEATIVKYVLQLHLALERWEQMAIDRLLTRPAMHVDETSIRVEKHNH